MDLRRVAARLAAWPERLPPVPAALTPTINEGGLRRPVPALTDPAAARPAAVLVLLVPDDAGAARVVLIRRATYAGPHSGEIALPGGAREPGDEDPAATAVREATEEIGLDPQAVGLQIVGRLESFWIPVSGYRVTPVVGIAAFRPRYRPDPREVVEVVEVPVEAFLPEAPIRDLERTVRGLRIRYGAYAWNGVEIWGATARILGQLGALLSEGKAPEGDRPHPS
jgi:8-oxo-dGTP pyrophosphatase MutT (NUDIX family)